MTKICKLIFFFLLLAISQDFTFAAPIEVRIGATVPLSSRMAFVGEDVQRGIQLAVEDFSNQQVAFKIFLEDNQHDSKLAVTTAHKLLDIDKVDVLLSMWDMADVVAPLAESKKILHIAIRANPHIAEKYQNTFTIESTYLSFIDSLLELVRSTGSKTISTITEDSQGWLLSLEYLQKVAPQRGFQLLGSDTYSSGDLDYKSLVLRASRRKADMLLVLSNPPHTEQIISRIREIAPKQRFTGYFETLEDRSIVEGIPFVGQFQVAEWFAQKFKKRFGDLPKIRASHAYDVVKLLAKSVEKSKTKPSAATFSEVLKQQPNFSGASGNLFVTNGKTIESKCIWQVTRKNVVVPYVADVLALGQNPSKNSDFNPVVTP